MAALTVQGRRRSQEAASAAPMVSQAAASAAPMGRRTARPEPWCRWAQPKKGGKLLPVVRSVAPIQFRVGEGQGREEQKMGMVGAGDGVGSRRGDRELVGAQGVLSAGWSMGKSSKKALPSTRL